jgi:predicted ATPase
MATSQTSPRSLGALTLTRARLDGFKAVKSSGDIDLSPLTLFIGRNGSGKSSFVEALQWLQDAFFSGIQAATEARFRSYLHLRNKRSNDTRLHLELKSQKGNKPVYFDLTVAKAVGPSSHPIVVNESLRVGQAKGQSKIISTVKGRKGPVFRRVIGRSAEREADSLAIYSASINAHPGIRAMSDFVRGIVVLRLSPTSMRWESSLDQRRGPRLDEDGAGLPALLWSLDLQQREWVREKISTVISGLRDVSVRQTDVSRGYVSATEQMKWPGGNKKFDIPAWMLSEGTRRMTALFALLAVRPRPSLLVVEEIENGLDPWTLEHVFSELREASIHGTQVIATTHSPFLLDHVAADEVIHVRRERGDSTYTPIKSYADVIEYDGAIAPGTMYISGYYGAREK